jgi:endonuclease-8
LDQSLVSGIGNVYRAEILFATGIHPERPAADVTADEWAAMWAAAVRMLRAGVRDRGEIVTVDPRDLKVRDRRRTYVYGQRMCARCGSAVRKWDLSGRDAWACETCQRR